MHRADKLALLLYPRGVVCGRVQLPPLLRFSEISCQRANDYAVLMASLEVGGAPFLKRCATLVGSSRRTLKRLHGRTSENLFHSLR
jgi:hypothetical protein